MEKYINNAESDFTYKEGIWLANKIKNISYPEEGNDNCFQIEDSSFWFNHRNKCISTVVERFIDEKVFFDIGGGNGFVSKGLQENNIEAYLVEPGSGVYNAKKRGVKLIIQATIDDDFKDDSIPNAGAFDVIEHVEDDVAFLNLINKKLQKEGLFFLTVPAYKFLWSSADKSAGHYRRYTLSSLNKKLAANNFEILYSTYFFHFLPLPVFLFRALPFLFGKEKNKKKQQNVKNLVKKPHKQNSKILDVLLEKELSLIKKGRRLPFGGSCLVVAKKN